MRLGNTLFSLAIALLFCLPANAQKIGLELAKSHLQKEVQQGKYAPADLRNPLVTDHYTSNDITHIYFRQTLNGIEITNANASVHIVNGNVLTSNSQFLPSLEKRNVQSQATLSAIDAIIKVSEQKSYPLNRSELKTVKNADRSEAKSAVYSAPSISYADIPARMVYIADKNGNLNLAWDIAIDEVAGEDYMNYIVDARTGKIHQEISWTTHCNFGDGHVHTEGCTSDTHNDKKHFVENSNTLVVPNTYNVFEVPVESPNFGGRSNVTAPWLANPTASPDQWHTINGTNYTVTRGNNVDCYLDNDDTNSPTGGDAARVDGGANLEFDFPWVDDGNPTAYQDAALTNLFYWSNITHDVWYNYGFDEASGNFQENNFGQGGQGSDSVNGEAQDGSGTCNANFSTPPDGSNPRMQMYLCNGRDGDYDNGVVVHEIGHGISIRLTGGASNSGCLSGNEQMGEGWSDYFGTVMTIEPGDQATDARPMGTYLFGQGPNGGGIRPFPYSTDLNVNPMTYATIGSGVSVPHGVGSVWATMLWDMTWDLIDVYGWDPDLYNGTGGNNIAMALVIEGLKLQPCGPGFVDGRDAILAADVALNGGANQCLIWESFARRGLGFSADQGSSASNTDGTEAFDLPPSCSIGLNKTANITQVTPGGNITYTLSATNNTGSTLNNVVISDDLPVNTTWVTGGSLSGNTVSFPSVSLANNATHTVSFVVQVDGTLNGNVPDFNDNMEGGAGNWITDNTGDSFWNLQSGTTNSGSNAWFAADVGTTSIANLIVATEKGLTNSSVLTFAHNYNTEATWDGGVVEISTNNGTTWTDLGDDMTTNGYNSTINSSRPAFSGNSGGFITTSVNLSAYADQNALIRFQMNCDVTVAGLGWYVDDVTINNLALYIPNIASVTDGNIISQGALQTPTLVTGGVPGPLGVTVNASNISCTNANDGTASALGTGGSNNYTYAWSNGAITATINGLSTGTYTVTVDDGSTTATGSVTISEPSLLDVTTSANPANNGNNGTASATANGGTPPYSYAWNNGDTGASITGLAPGDYIVIVTDANGCTVSQTITVQDNNVPSYCTIQGTNQNFEFIEAVALNAMNNVSGDDGGYGDYTSIVTNLEQGATANVTLTPGFVGQDYQEGWRIWIDYNQDLDFNDAGEEVFAPALSDAAITGTFVIPANAPLGTTRMRISMRYNTVPPNCGDFADGEAEDYTVNITGPTTTPITLAVSGTDLNCFGSNNGTAKATASGGTGNFTYIWSNGGNTETINNLGAGTYSVTVSDGVSTEIGSITINEPSEINISTDGTNVTCNGTADGTATAFATGGTGTISYEWSDGQTGTTATNLGAGIYLVTAMDENGCTVSTTVTISEPNPISISIISTNASCAGADGSATANAAGGTGLFSYAWSTGATTATISNLDAGVYTVTATDENGCISSEDVTITSPSDLSVSANSTDVTCNDFSDGKAFATISGGNGNISYTWNGNAGSANLNNIPAGTYTVVVSDGSGCTASATTTISEPSAISITVSGVDANSGNNGSATVIATGGTPPYTYNWSNGGNTATITGLLPGTYEVNVSDANDCQVGETITINDATPPTEDYCESQGLNTNFEFIESVAMDGNANASGNNNGYADFTGYVFELEQGGEHDLLLTPGFTSSTYTENWKIWIDFNQDSDFDDAGEEVFSGSSDAAISGLINIPIGASLGQTRMRISMQWGGTPEPCSTFTYGEVEDYTVDITEAGTGGACTYEVINSNNFENGWGIWNDGGSDCRRSANDAPYANSGNYCVRLRDNTSTSTMTTDVLNLSAYEELTVNFSYIARSMDNANEDFWLQISNNGGASFVTVEEWNRGDEFENGERKFDEVTINGLFSANTVLRFRCDASGNADWVYIDDVVLSGCINTASNFANPLVINENKVKTNEVEDREDDNLDNEDYLLDTPNELKIFPNPVNDQLTVAYQFAEMHDTQLIIADFTGRIIQQVDTPAGAHQTRVDVSQFTPGYYLVRVISGEKQMSEKFAVVR